MNTENTNTENTEVEVDRDYIRVISIISHLLIILQGRSFQDVMDTIGVVLRGPEEIEIATAVLAPLLSLEVIEGPEPDDLDRVFIIREDVWDVVKAHKCAPSRVEAFLNTVTSIVAAINKSKNEEAE